MKKDLISNRNLDYWCLAALLAAFAGCGSSDGLEGLVPIRGEVTYQGKPLTSGEVRYLPVNSSQGRVARGNLDASGKFQLTTLKTGDGALPGEYAVVVVARRAEMDDLARRENDEKQRASAEEPPIPARYYKPETSGLTDKVDENHSGFKQIDLVD